MQDRKRCTQCRTFQPLTNFHKNSHSPTGYKGACKTCTNRASRIRYRDACLKAKGLYVGDAVRMHSHEQALRNAILDLRAGKTACAIQVRGAILPWDDALYLKKGMPHILVCKSRRGRIEFNLKAWDVPSIADVLWKRGIEVLFQ